MECESKLPELIVFFIALIVLYKILFNENSEVWELIEKTKAIMVWFYIIHFFEVVCLLYEWNDKISAFNQPFSGGY